MTKYKINFINGHDVTVVVPEEHLEDFIMNVYSGGFTEINNLYDNGYLEVGVTNINLKNVVSIIKVK